MSFVRWGCFFFVSHYIVNSFVISSKFCLHIGACPFSKRLNMETRYRTAMSQLYYICLKCFSVYLNTGIHCVLVYRETVYPKCHCHNSLLMPFTSFFAHLKNLTCKRAFIFYTVHDATTITITTKTSPSSWWSSHSISLPIDNCIYTESL